MYGCQKELSGSLQVKRDKYVIYVNFYDGGGKRRPKQIHTGLCVKGYNKRLAEDLKDLALHMLNNENADFENVKSAILKQAKIGMAPKVETAVTVAEESCGLCIQPVVTAEIATTVYSKNGQGDVGDEPNPFIVPDKIMEIVNIAPKPKFHTGSALPGDSIPLVTYLRNWMSGQKHEVNHNTYASYEMQMSLRIIPFFSFFGLSLSDLVHTHVKMFYDYILDAPRLDGKSGKVSSTTVHRVHSVFHKALNDALEGDYIVANPVARVHPPREKPFSPQYYSADQITAFLSAGCYRRHGGNTIGALVFFGTRRSETLGLKESAINFGANIIYINHTVNVGQRKYDFVKMDAQGLVKEDRTKSKKSNRALPVPEVFMDFLKRTVVRNGKLREIFGPSWNPDGYLCVTNEGKLIHPNTMSKHYKSVAKKAGLPVNRLHDARHSIASLMIQNGTDIKTQHLEAPAAKVQELIAFEGLSG